MEGKQLFKGPLDQSERVGSDAGFWSKVFQQLADAEETYASRLQKVVGTLDEKLGYSGLTARKETSRDFQNLILHVGTFKDHVITQRCKAMDTMQVNLTRAMELRRVGNDEMVKAVSKIDGIAMDSLTKEFKKKETCVQKSKLAYHREMEQVELTKLTMLRLGYDADTLERRLATHERGSRDARARYNHCIRQAESQLHLLTTASRQCERDWKTMEIERTGHVIKAMDGFLKDNCTTCVRSEVNLSDFINIPKLVCAVADKEEIPPVEFEEYEMSLLRLVMSKLNCQISDESENHTGHFDYDITKVKVCHVIKAFSDKRPHFLTLRKGMTVTELIPATSQGWAYGEARSKHGSELIFGFYNVGHVEYTSV